MGNLEKAGVLVVVGLLAVILVVAFLNFPDQGQKRPPVLGASVGKLADEASAARPKPTNVGPSGTSVIRPDPQGGVRSPTTAPPVVLDPPPVIVPNPDRPAPKSDHVVSEPEPEPKRDSEESKAPAAKDGDKNPGSSVPGYPKVVKVQRGDTLWAIAVREYGPKIGPRMLGSIADANPKLRPEALKAGAEVSLPAPPRGAETASKPKTEPAPRKAVASPPSAPRDSASKPPAARKLPFVPVGN